MDKLQRSGPFVPDPTPTPTPTPTPVPPPGKVSNITLTRADGSLTATWDAPDGATKYHITYSSDNRASWSLGAFDHAQNSLTISPVDNDATYIVGIRAGNESGYGGWTNSSAIGPFIPDPTPTPEPTPTPTPTPTPEPDPPTAPSSVTVTRGDDTISASWPAVSNATKYHITYSYNSKQSWTAASDNHTGTSITINANNGKTYHVAVRAGNSAGWSGWTNSSASAPTATPGIIVQDSSGNAITTLSVPEGGEATYQVKLASQPDSYVEICIGLSVRDRNDGSITFKGEPNGTVAIKVPFTPENWDTAQTVTLVAAEDDDSDNGVRDVINDTRDFVEYFSGAVWLAVTEIDNDAPAAPTGLSVTPSDDSLEITWDAVSSATGYDVRAKAEGASDWHDVASNVTGTSYTYSTSETMYFIGVRARNANGASAWTNVSHLPSEDLLNVATGLSFGGASIQSGASASNKLAAPTWGTVTRDLRRAAKLGDGFININWTGTSGATGYSLACSHYGWVWHKCGWDNSGTVTFTTVPSGQSQPVKLSHYKREIYNPGDYGFGNSRSYTVAIRAVNNNPAQASEWVNTPTLRPVSPWLRDLTVTRTDGQIALSWTPNFWTTDYDIYCHQYTPGATYNPDYTLCATLTDQDDTASSHSVTISTWTADGTNYSIDNNKVVDLAIDSKNTWTKARYLLPLIDPLATLTASDVTKTTATLTVGNHSGQWWYKANAAPDNTCQGPVAANTASKDLTGLSSFTTYTYKAYSASGCASANLLATASAFTTGVSVSNLSETEASTALNLGTDWGQEFTTGSAANGYKLQSVTLDFALVNPSANITVSIREQESNNHPATTDKAALTGTPATGQVTFTCSGAGCNLNASTTYFVFVTGGDSVSNLKSVTSDNETLQPSTNGWSIENATRYQGGGWGLHPQGVSMKMKIEALGHPSLAGSSTSSTGATLAISQHTGSWYYKADTGPHTTCQGPVSTKSVTLSSLTAGTSYTYTAYSDSGCATPLASASFATPPGNPTNITVGNSGTVGTNRNYPVSWGKPAGAQASDAFAYQVQCTNQNNRNTTIWNSCGTHNVSSTANATVSRTVQHGWLAPLFYYVRVRTEKNGLYSDWVIAATQYGS